MIRVIHIYKCVYVVQKKKKNGEKDNNALRNLWLKKNKIETSWRLQFAQKCIQAREQKKNENFFKCI